MNKFEVVTLYSPELSSSILNTETDKLKNIITKNNGKLTWLIELEPNTSVTKSFSYVIKYPEDKHVYGL